MAKMVLTLHIAERDALFKLAECERRDPRAQAALLLRGELERRGLLPVNTPTPTADAITVPGAQNVVG